MNRIEFIEDYYSLMKEPQIVNFDLLDNKSIENIIKAINAQYKTTIYKLITEKEYKRINHSLYLKEIFPEAVWVYEVDRDIMEAQLNTSDKIKMILDRIIPEDID